MKILFLGDSITQSGRNLQDAHDLGDGYVKITASKLRPLYPETTFEWINKGVSGDCTADLLARLQQDVLDEKPDFVVLQAGVNDVWRRFQTGEVISTETFAQNYASLVSQIKSCGAKLFLLQPFALNVGDKWRLRPQLKEFNQVIREIAQKEEVALIPLDEIFIGVTQDIHPAQFATDGVHPTHRGCRYIADLVIKALKKYLA